MTSTGMTRLAEYRDRWKLKQYELAARIQGDGMTGTFNGEIDEPKDVPWSRWYRLAREEAAFRYGLRGIPVDEYKEAWVTCETVTQAVRIIAKRRGLAGGR